MSLSIHIHGYYTIFGNKHQVDVFLLTCGKIQAPGELERKRKGTTVEKKKAAAAAVASVIAASGAAVDVAVDNPADILQHTNVDPKVDYIHPDSDTDLTAQDSEKQKQKKTAREAFSEWILGLPYAVRVCFVLPLWAIGTLVVGGGQLLFAGLSPIANWLLGFALMALVIGAAFTITAKAMFPDLPLRKILNRHTIKWILVASVLAFAADLLLGVFWPAYTAYKTLFIALILLLATGSLTIWFSRREKRRREKLAAREEIEEEAEQILEYTSLGETFTVRPSSGNR